MGIENLKTNIVNVHVSGVARVLNLEQVIFATVGSSTSAVFVNEGSVQPATFTIEGDFRNIIAGIRPGTPNGSPVFGVFTDVSSKVPVVINFDKMNRFIAGNSIKFSRYGTVTAFTFNLLEDPIDVLGNSGYSPLDVGLFSVNNFNGNASAPVQSAASTSATGGAIANNTYFLKVTALTAFGETTGSNEVSITTTGTGLSTITANWAAVTGATRGYRVYFGTSSGAQTAYFTASAGSTSLLMTSLVGTSGTVPTTNTAFQPSSHEIINAKNVTHQVPSGTNWVTTFVDNSSVTYVESLQDLVGGP